MLPAIRAVIVGIDTYPTFEPLRTAVRDAQRIYDYLKDELGAETENLKLLTNDQAKKDDITAAILAVEKNAVRNAPIIFFFSGYAGQTNAEEGEMEATLCTVDVNETGGISDTTLLQLFDQISKSCGNNITVILDCPAKIFTWVNPTSFVVVAPDTAKEGADGGAFTQAMLKVLKHKSTSMKTMTVEAFAGHVQAVMDGVEVRAFGANVNRPLFNVKGDKSHHAFIPCRTMADGRIALCIGTPQGVRVGATYGIYPGNIKGSNRLGNLEVEALDDNCMMATFHDCVNFNVPSFFYAVEEDKYFDPVKIFVTGSGDTEADPLARYSGWANSTREDGAPITAKVVGEKVSMRWNGFAEDPKITEMSFDVELNNAHSIQREIRRGARFHHLVGAPSPDLSSISSGLKIRFGRVDVQGQNILDNDNFKGLQTIELDVKKGEPLGPYSLTIVNNNTHSVWPYVFLCDPERYTIRPWYLPHAGLLRAPLEADKELVVGSEDDGKGLMFVYKKTKAREYTYMKVFVTKERMDFTALQQWFTSPTEDILRGHFKFHSAIPITRDLSDLRSPEKEREADLKKLVSSWASLRLAIVEKYIDN